MPGRNRAEEWQHAKLSGHNNERLVAKMTVDNIDVQKRILKYASLYDVRIDEVEYGGLHEKNVGSILGGNTKSKTDMRLYLSNGEHLNLSIKKDYGGQVFLIGIDRFIEGFERQYNVTIDNRIKRAMGLYFGSSDDVNDIVRDYGRRNRSLELRKHRVVAKTLEAYDPELYYDLLYWLDDNMADVFDFCFSRGLAENREDWADIIWYINLIGENQLDKMFYIPDIARRMPRGAVYGTRNGGSTIQLPFGFVQWHSPRKTIPGDMQFHHSYKRICEIAGRFRADAGIAVSDL